MTADDVVAAARAVIEGEGVEALTMRRLSDDLDVAVTSIYWHVGRRDEVIDEVIAQFVDEIGEPGAGSEDPGVRIAEITRQFRTVVLDHPHLVSAAYDRGRLGDVFRPMRAALVNELAAIGQHGESAAMSVLAIEAHVVASSLLERSLRTHPPVVGADAWPADLDDSELVAAYDRLVGTSVVFDVGLDALIAARLGD